MCADAVSLGTAVGEHPGWFGAAGVLSKGR
jgi:hypothetical protein